METPRHDAIRDHHQSSDTAGELRRLRGQNVAVPWAGKHSRFTLLFDAFAIQVLKSSASISSACQLLKLDWSAADRIMSRAVERGLARRSDEPVEKLGIDEKSFRSGHRYVSTLNDLAAERVIEVMEGTPRQ